MEDNMTLDLIIAELKTRADCYTLSMKLLYDLIHNRGENIRYLEFGTGRACSAHMVASLKNVNSVLTIDILPNGECNQRPFGSYANWESREDIISRLAHLPGSNKITYLDNTNSHDLTIDQLGEPYDVIYIDGDHTEEGVINDWNLAMQVIKPDGLIIFDDYGDCGCPSVKAGIDKTAAQEYSDIFIDRGWHCSIDFRSQ